MGNDIKILKYSFDVLNSINSIDIHLNYKKSYQEYITNLTVQRAVERELEIIGEAINNVLKLDKEIKISYSRLIVDLRNKIIHSYDNINHDVIWKIVIKDIPILKEEISQLIQKFSKSQ